MSQAQSGPVKYRRHTRNLLIYPKFQMRLIAANFAILLITFSAVTFQAWRSFKHIERLGLNTGLPAQHPFFKFIAFQSATLIGYLTVAFVVASLASLAYSLYLSHRVAGPIVRLKNYFSQLEEKGEVSDELKFRDGDFFEDLPEKVNGALSAVQKQPENAKKAG